MSVDLRTRFRIILTELTFNSKIIINDLTKLAEDNPRQAGMIVDTIQDQLAKVSPKIKIPVLYLLDSVLKNVGQPYIDLFGKNLLQTLLGVYAVVLDQDRERIKKLVATWRNFNGIPLFPLALLDHIQGELVKYGQDPKPVPNLIPLNLTPIHAQIPSIYHAPSYQTPQTQLPIPLSMPIHSLGYQAPMPMAPPMAMAYQINPAAIAVQQQILNILNQKLSLQRMSPNPTTAHQIQILQQLLEVVKSTPLDTMALNQISLQIQSMNAPALIPPFLGSIAKPQAPQMSLTLEDIVRVIPGSVETLYENLGLQCKQCGYRLVKSDQGEIDMRAHLDWHFRQNKRVKEGKKTLCRDWYLEEPAWISEESVDETEVAPAFFGQDVQVVLEEPELPSIKAQGDDLRCSICQEPFDTYFDEDADEWMLKGAVQVNDQIIHQACQDTTLKRKSETNSPVLGHGGKKVKSEL